MKNRFLFFGFLVLVFPLFGGGLSFGKTPLGKGFSFASKEVITLSSPIFPSFSSKQIQHNPFFQGNSPEKTPKIKKKQNRFGQWLIKLQRTLSLKLAKYVKEIREGNSVAFWSALGLALLYGVAHAAGPGHRKVVLFSYFSSHRHPLYRFIAASFATTALHAFAAIVLTSSLFFIMTKAINTRVDNVSKITETVSWFFIAIFGIGMLLTSTIQWVKKITQTEKNSPQGSIIPSTTHSPNSITSKGGLWLLVFFSGIIPCPAASTIMIITLQQKILWLGITMVIALSLGMGITVSLAALPGFLSNRGIEKLKRDYSSKKGDFIEWILETVSALFLIIFALFMGVPSLL